jgi:hypothetical protein
MVTEYLPRLTSACVGLANTQGIFGIRPMIFKAIKNVSANLSMV